MKKKLFVLLLSMFSLTAFNNSNAQNEGMIGEVKMFAGNFAPRGWMLCQGQLLAISQNEALFSILGTQYGGDGRTTFGLPDLRGRVALGNGNGPGLTGRKLGEKGGAENTTITYSNLPGHTHTVTVPESTNAEMREVLVPLVEDDSFVGEVIMTPIDNSVNDRPATTTVQSGMTGESVPINNMQPSLTINYIICIIGVYPNRN